MATSGDTGGAVAAAFHRRHWSDVVLLYPKGLVSPRQAQQLSCWGDNVRTFAVHGTFDDCQRMVKGAMRDPGAHGGARVLVGEQHQPRPAAAADRLLRGGEPRSFGATERRKPNFIVPSGNLGNVVACVLARDMGLPIGDIVLATNANRTVTDTSTGGEWRPRPSVATLASAMDVGDPSNMERLRSGVEAVEQLRDTRDGVQCHRRADPRDHPGGRRTRGSRVVPAQRDRGVRLSRHARALGPTSTG